MGFDFSPLETPSFPSLPTTPSSIAYVVSRVHPNTKHLKAVERGLSGSPGSLVFLRGLQKHPRQPFKRQFTWLSPNQLMSGELSIVDLTVIGLDVQYIYIHSQSTLITMLFDIASTNKWKYYSYLRDFAKSTSNRTKLYLQAMHKFSSHPRGNISHFPHPTVGTIIATIPCVVLKVNL